MNATQKTAKRTDDGTIWATSWAWRKLTKPDEERIAALVKKAVS